MNTLLHMKLLKIYVQAKPEVKETARDAIGKVLCYCRKGGIHFQT